MGRLLEKMTETVLKYATPRQAAAIKAYQQYGNERKAAKSLGISQSSLHNLLERALKKAAIYGSETELNDLRALQSTHIIKGTSTLTDADGSVLLNWTKTDAKMSAILKAMEEFAHAIAGDLQPIPPIPSPRGKLATDTAICYIIGDGHLGLRSWEMETGEDYDLSLGIADHIAASAWLAEHTPKTELAFLVNVGDLLHCNDTTEMTPASKHKLDADSRFPLVARRAGSMMRTIIDGLARKHNRVWIVNARGNHDPDAAWWLNYNLETAYEKNKRIRVLPNEAKIQHIEWGQNFLPIYHGDRVRPERMHGKLTSGRFREIRGRCKHAHALNGHIHHSRVVEIGGIKFETFNSLVAPDQYHEESGYGAARSMTAIHYHKEHGEIGRTVCPQELARSLAKIE